MNINQQGPQNPTALFKALSIIHAALVIGQLLFAVVSLVNTQSHGVTYHKNNDKLLYIAPVLAISGFGAGMFIYKQLIIKISPEATLMSKLTGYQSAMIVRDALLEGPSLFCVVGYLLSGNIVLLVISEIIMLYFIAIRPTKEKLKNDLNLSYEEEMELN